ncbi:unnamed protein product [Vicia faba]|uniref:Kinesin motor domain-containing protein n=1 Tax=Vicia faba TaxID=3906 RepID=A0AAV0YV84_VICFA|nr:unnamed protein product [Vicia faba]
MFVCQLYLQRKWFPMHTHLSHFLSLSLSISISLFSFMFVSRKQTLIRLRFNFCSESTLDMARPSEVVKDINDREELWNISIRKVCMFAYDQTGSGKTYTMMGKPGHPGGKGFIAVNYVVKHTVNAKVCRRGKVWYQVNQKTSFSIATEICAIDHIHR